MTSRYWHGSTRQWRKLRQQILDRDQHRCQLKLDGCTTIATCVHHTLGKRHGDDPAQLVAACQHCNLKIGDPERATPDPQHKRITRWDLGMPQKGR